VGVDGLEPGHVAIHNAERFIRGSRLDAVSYRELSLELLLDADASESAGIVGRKLSVRFFDRELFAAGLSATTEA
jgi:hypothetical protein